MATKKDQPTEDTRQDAAVTDWLFPNKGQDIPKGAQPFAVQAATAEEADRLNQEYLDGLRNKHKKETT